MGGTLGFNGGRFGKRSGQGARGNPSLIHSLSGSRIYTARERFAQYRRGAEIGLRVRPSPMAFDTWWPRSEIFLTIGVVGRWEPCGAMRLSPTRKFRLDQSSSSRARCKPHSDYRRTGIRFFGRISKRGHSLNLHCGKGSVAIWSQWVPFQYPSTDVFRCLNSHSLEEIAVSTAEPFVLTISTNLSHSARDSRTSVPRCSSDEKDADPTSRARSESGGRRLGV